MDFFIKDEPLDLDFNLEEEFINEIPNGNNVIGEITALVKKAQVFLQESAYDMKNMHDSFEKMKKRHAENTRITYRVLQLLTTFNVSPASINHDNNTYANLQLENIDSERPPDNTSMDHAFHELQSDDIEIMEFSQLEKDSNYTTKEGVDEIPSSTQKESEYNSFPNRNQYAKHSSSGETQSFQLEDDDESEILYVDVLSVDSKTDDCTNKTSNNAESSNPQGNKYKRELLTCDVCKKKVKNLSNHLKIHSLFTDEIKQICHEKKQQKPLKTKIGLRCPFSQCSKVSSYVRLDKHLLHFHKLKMSHPLYRQFRNTNILPNKITKSKTMPKLSPVVAAESGKSTDTGRTPEQDLFTEIEYSTIASDQFFDFLISENGGSVKRQNANHYRTKIRKILEGSDIKKVEEFESQEVVLKLCNWFESYLETNKKASAKSYMSVLTKFLYYLGIKYFWKNYKYNSLIIDVKERMNSVSKKNISEKMPVHDITPLEIRAFDISDIGRKCKSNLEMVKSGIITTVSSMEHCQIRNYLVLSAILRNGWKSCALSNMTLQELKEPKKELRNGTMHYNIYIQDHKSRKEPGPMRVTLGEELYNHYLCYVEKIRPLIVPVDSNIQTVFITLNGYSINTDDMCDGILAMWKEARLKTYITTAVLKDLITNRINPREDGKIIEDLSQQSKNSYENIELSQNVAPSDMYRMLSDENISEFSSSLENDTHTQLECNSGTSSIKVIPQFSKHQPDLSSLPSKSNLTHDHPTNEKFQDATCNSKLEDSVGTATLLFDSGVTKNKMATCQDKKDSYAKSSNIVTMRRREVGRERLCKNCPICPKKIKVNSNCSVASICSQSNKNTDNVSHGKSCPLKGCEEKGKFKRLDYHLKRKHNLSTDSHTYQTLCSVRGDSLQKGLKKMNDSPASSKDISSEMSQYMSDDTCSKISRANIESSSVDSTFREAGSPIISQPISKQASPASSNNNNSSNISQNIPEDESSELSWVNMENSSVEARPNMEVSDVYGIKGRKTFNLEERDLIIKTFQEYIEKNCLPSIPIIREYMNKKSPLNSIVKKKNYQPSQIKGCLLNIINKRKKDEMFFEYSLRQGKYFEFV